MGGGGTDQRGHCVTLKKYNERTKVGGLSSTTAQGATLAGTEWESFGNLETLDSRKVFSTSVLGKRAPLPSTLAIKPILCAKGTFHEQRKQLVPKNGYFNSREKSTFVSGKGHLFLLHKKGGRIELLQRRLCSFLTV